MAPPSVQLIFKLWEELNPNASFTVLERKEVEDIISRMGVDPVFLTPQVKANIVRTYLLAEYGGVWADATLLPTKPLSSWLRPDMLDAGFFAFRSTGNPFLILQNWFLYSEPGNQLTKRWLEFYCEYFSVRRYLFGSKRPLLSTFAFDYIRASRAIKRRDFLYFVDPLRGKGCRGYPYAMHNYTLAHLLLTEPEVKSVWDRVPERYHLPPSLIGQCSHDLETQADTFYAAALELMPFAPLHKLNHRDSRFELLIRQALERGLVTMS